MTDVPNSGLTPEQEAHDVAVPADPSPLADDAPDTAPDVADTVPTTGEVITAPQPDAPGEVAAVDPNAGPGDGAATFAAATEATEAPTEATFAAATEPVAAEDPSAPSSEPAASTADTAVTSGLASAVTTVDAPQESSVPSPSVLRDDAHVTNEDLHALLTDIRKDISDTKAMATDVLAQIAPHVEKLQKEGLGSVIKSLIFG